MSTSDYSLNSVVGLGHYLRAAGKARVSARFYNEIFSGPIRLGRRFECYKKHVFILRSNVRKCNWIRNTSRCDEFRFRID